MKDTIPTKKITLPKSKTEVEIYEWLLQSEEDEYLALQAGDNKIDGEGNISLSVRDLATSRKYLVEKSVKGITYNEFDALSPADRDFLLAEINKTREEKKV